MATDAQKRQEERLAAMGASVRRQVDDIAELLDLDAPARSRVSAAVDEVLGMLVSPVKQAPPEPKLKKYVVRVQELQRWYQPFRVHVSAHSREEAAAKGVCAVRTGEACAKKDGAAVFLEADYCDWGKLQLAGVTDAALRDALRAADVRMEPCATTVCVPTIRKVEVEETT